MIIGKQLLKPSKYQVDQSGKIEQTNKNTVIAYANGSYSAVTISSREKRKLQEYFRLRGQPRLFVDLTFSTLLYLLIQDLPTGNFLVDTEYPGHTKIIESIINQLGGKSFNIEWTYVGKTSPAHDVAFKVYKKKLKIGRNITAIEVWNLAQKILKEIKTKK